MLGPVREHLLQHARRRGLADRHRARQPDDERGARRLRLVEELLRGAVQVGRRLHVEAEQGRQRQVDLLHLLEVQLVPEAADAVDLLGGQRLLGGAGEVRPGVPVELDVRRALARVRAVGHARHPRPARSPSRAGQRPQAGRNARPRLTRMCGIVGYVGDKPARDVVIEGLRRLEYRGYDSAGIALAHDGGDRLGQAGRQAGQPREVHRGDTAAGLDDRHRAHALGHPRCPQRRQRAPARRPARPGGRRTQRHHRELRDAARRARARRPRPALGDRHRGRRAPHRARARRER